MPTQKTPAVKAKRDLPSIPKELVEQLVKGPMTAEAIQDISMAFKKALVERALGAELG
ncbi:MAG: IS256 family transposase, partial [Pseudomonadota bacterium]|nr:IS256 family transposase [Pseudomonadota bacterium]